jgi:glyoxylase-like metal-dependent hydrolase (beta-lactamase superfamily II)
MYPFHSRFAVPAIATLLAATTACAAPLSSPAAVAAAVDASPEPPASSAAAPRTTSTLGVVTSDDAGFDTHSFFYDTGREVVVFDAQFTPAYAEMVIDAIQKQTPSPITWVVVTHPNPDKFNGASAFQAIGAKVVASEATARAIPAVHAYKKNFFVNVAKSFTDSTYPAEAHVDVTFQGRFSLPLAGGAAVDLVDLGRPGVSSTQTIAVVPAANAVVVGDLVHGRAHAWLEGGIVDGAPVPTLDAWRDILRDLGGMAPLTVYGGRGDALPADEAAAQETAYLDGMEALVRDYVTDLGPKKTELFGDAMPAHAHAIAERAAARFPGYAYPFMVEYGVYGLAQQIARTN